MLLKVLHVHLRFCFLIIFLLLLTMLSIYFSWQHDEFSQFDRSMFVQRSLTTMNSSCQRAILVFYPSNQEEYYLPELRWLFRSWIEMMKFEFEYCRTDLIIFTDKFSSNLIHLNCLVNQIRQDDIELAQCRVITYLRISAREIHPSTKQQKILLHEQIKHLFQINRSRSKLLYEQLRTYQYVDSINILAESSPIYSYYDWILKTDLDVFLTKSFAKFQPNISQTLYVGRGGYSTEFNTRRLGRIARDMGWNNHNLTNIGSTWYGSPDLIYRISNLTLDAMLYLSQNEFTRVERQQKLAALLWPDWHYGVLSMYGSHLAINHLIISNGIDIRNGDQLLDQPTTNTQMNDIEKHHRLHLHCWHTDEQFSKFQFKANRYNHIDPSTLINDQSPRGYAMRMALESRSMTCKQLGEYFHDVRRRTKSYIHIPGSNE